MGVSNNQATDRESRSIDLEAVAKQVTELQSQLDALKGKTASNKVSLIVFSGDLDKALAAFVIATGAVAMGMEAVMFFTFWGTPLLRDKNKHVGGKDVMSKMFGAMLPTGAGQTKLSKMNMGGMGTSMMKALMKKKNVNSLEEFLAIAEELEVRIFICEMSMDLMGFKREEMIDYKHLTYGGVAGFLAEAMDSRIQLFI
jgi:peroxiredoxin family protein